MGFADEVNQTMTERFRHYMPDHALPYGLPSGSPPSATQRCASRFELRPFFRNDRNEPELIFAALPPRVVVRCSLTWACPNARGSPRDILPVGVYGRRTFHY